MPHPRATACPTSRVVGQTLPFRKPVITDNVRALVLGTNNSFLLLPAVLCHHRRGDDSRRLLGLPPAWAAVHVLRIEFAQDYTIILQHWGFLLGLVSVIMHAREKELATTGPHPLRLRKGIHCLPGDRQRQLPYSHGFWMGAAMDAAVALYTMITSLLAVTPLSYEKDSR